MTFDICHHVSRVIGHAAPGRGTVGRESQGVGRGGEGVGRGGEAPKRGGGGRQQVSHDSE